MKSPPKGKTVRADIARTKLELAHTELILIDLTELIQIDSSYLSF